eukprot:g2292.t2
MCSSTFNFIVLCLLMTQSLATEHSSSQSAESSSLQFPTTFRVRRLLQGSCQSENDRDWFGGDLVNTPFTHTSPQQCCDRCRETNGCVGWLFRENHNHCYLKRELRNDQPCPDCVRGRIDDDAPVTTADFNRNCNSQTGTDYAGGDIYNTPFNINDPGVCCEYCQEDPACKAWIWRRRHNHCWLKNVVNTPSDCEDCTGGVLDDQVTVDVPEPLDFVERCESDGERVAVAVAAGACAVLENRCPPAAQLVELTPDDDVSAPNRESDVIRANEAILEEAFDQALSESCIRVFEETCKRAAAEKARIHFQECASILANGPEFEARLCKDVNQALRLFNDEVDPLCSFDATLGDI